MRRLLFLLFVAGAAWAWWPVPQPLTVSLGVADLPVPPADPGTALASMPLQRPAAPGTAAVTLGDYVITPLAEFHAEARVLGAERYRVGREAELAPVDLALGWGPMAEDRVVGEIEVRQSGRWYRWRADTLPIPRRDIERHSANVHMIPADAEVEAALRRVRTGHTVRLRGHLVEVAAGDGWRWRSSLSRDDTGQGGCELLLVQALEVL